MKIWQGGFLDMTGELTNRGNRGLALGYESREIGFGDTRVSARAARTPRGKPIDFSFKEAKVRRHRDVEGRAQQQGRPARADRGADAQFLGYSRDSKSKTAAPAFRYRVGQERGRGDHDHLDAAR